MSETTTDRLKNQAAKTGDYIKGIISGTAGKTGNYVLITFTVIFVILFVLITWIFNTLNLETSNCNKLDSIYPAQNPYKTFSFFNDGNTDGTSVKSIETGNPNNFFDSENKSLLRNYYIKTAYNCCCGDGYKNNFVNQCALVKCIEQGARCLDFEIYSLNDEPIIAASTANNNSIKETYNFLTFTDVLAILAEKSFDAIFDPMILHFRIMSANPKIYDKMADYINAQFGEETLLDSKFGLANPYYDSTNADKLLTGPVKFLKKKFIVAVHTTNNTILEQSKLYQLANFRSGSSKFKLYRYDEIVASGPKNPILIPEAQVAMTIVLPNINNSIVNNDFTLPLSNGCQLIAMKFQNMDNNLASYFKFFKDQGGYSFALKPLPLRQDLATTEVIAPGISIDLGPPNTGIGG